MKQSSFDQVHGSATTFYWNHLQTLIPPGLIHWLFGFLIAVVISTGIYFLLRGRKFFNRFIDKAFDLIGDAKCIYHNYSIQISEFAGTIVIFILAVKSYIAYQEEKSVLYGCLTILVAIGKAYWRVMRVRKGIGKEFETIYESKLNMGKAFNKFNDHRSPVYIPNLYDKVAVDGLLREVLLNQLELVKKLFRPGFSAGGEDKYSVSILFYDPRTSVWDLYATICLPGDTRESSSWPISKKDFIFKDELYSKKPDIIYDVTEIPKPKYESILQIPLYLRKSYDKSVGLNKGSVYCIVSFASKKRKSFQKLKSLTGPVRRLFLPEIYVLEKYLYKTYRNHVKI